MADIDKIKIGSTTYNISPSWNNITDKPSTYPPASHAHSSILDSGDAHSTTFAYSKSGLNYDDYTWLAVWNGYELRSVNKSQFATSSHNHDGRYYTESEIDAKLKTIQTTPGPQGPQGPKGDPASISVNGKEYNRDSSGKITLPNYFPANGEAVSGTLNLANSTNGIRFTSSSSTAYYITNIESGSVTLSGMNTASSGTRKTISVNFHNGSKGSGSWYVVATAKGSGSTFPEYVTVGVTSISNSGFTIHARKITSSPGGSPDLDVDYVAIKYY